MCKHLETDIFLSLNVCVQFSYWMKTRLLAFLVLVNEKKKRKEKKKLLCTD